MKCKGSNTKNYSRKIATTGKRHMALCTKCHRYAYLTKDGRMFKHED